MKKDFQDIADQVGLYIDASNTKATMKEIEFFAEAVVRECANICNRIDFEYEGEDVLATWCSSAILKHFGIK